MGIFGKMKDSTSAGFGKVGIKRDKKPEEPIKPLIPFTKKCTDQSIETGYQFTFICDINDEEIQTGFYESRTASKGAKLRIVGKSVNVTSSVASKLTSNPFSKGGDKIGDKSESLADAIAGRYSQMSPRWHKEHAEAFDLAQEDAKKHFKKCPKCGLWACEYCWNVERGMCKKDADDSALCPYCYQLAGKGKFCKNCGKPLKLICEKCNYESEHGTKFCGGCGNPLS